MLVGKQKAHLKHPPLATKAMYVVPNPSATRSLPLSIVSTTTLLIYLCTFSLSASLVWSTIFIYQFYLCQYFIFSVQVFSTPVYSFTRRYTS